MRQQGLSSAAMAARGYARGGTVGELVIGPGEVRAAVQGRRARPYQVRVRVRVLDAEEWDRVLDAIAARIGHAAALLDGELFGRVGGDLPGWTVAGSRLAAAALFQPARTPPPVPRRLR